MVHSVDHGLNSVGVALGELDDSVIWSHPLRFTGGFEKGACSTKNMLVDDERLEVSLANQ